jgi:hypothetical protein
MPFSQEHKEYSDNKEVFTPLGIPFLYSFLVAMLSGAIVSLFRVFIVRAWFIWILIIIWLLAFIILVYYIIIFRNRLIILFSTHEKFLKILWLYILWIISNIYLIGIKPYIDLMDVTLPLYMSIVLSIIIAIYFVSNFVKFENIFQERKVLKYMWTFFSYIMIIIILLTAPLSYTGKIYKTDILAKGFTYDKIDIQVSKFRNNSIARELNARIIYPLSFETELLYDEKIKNTDVVSCLVIGNNSKYNIFHGNIMYYFNSDISCDPSTAMNIVELNKSNKQALSDFMAGLWSVPDQNKYKIIIENSNIEYISNNVDQKFIYKQDISFEGRERVLIPLYYPESFLNISIYPHSLTINYLDYTITLVDNSMFRYTEVIEDYEY